MSQLLTHTYLEKMHHGFHSSVNLREGIRGPEKKIKLVDGWMMKTYSVQARF